MKKVLIFVYFLLHSSILLSNETNILSNNEVIKKIELSYSKELLGYKKRKYPNELYDSNIIVKTIKNTNKEVIVSAYTNTESYFSKGNLIILIAIIDRRKNKILSHYIHKEINDYYVGFDIDTSSYNFMSKKLSFGLITYIEDSSFSVANLRQKYLSVYEKSNNELKILMHKFPIFTSRGYTSGGVRCYYEGSKEILEVKQGEISQDYPPIYFSKEIYTTKITPKTKKDEINDCIEVKNKTTLNGVKLFYTAGLYQKKPIRKVVVNSNKYKNLYRISLATKFKVKDIMRYNSVDSNNLKLGSIIVLPED